MPLVLSCGNTNCHTYHAFMIFFDPQRQLPENKTCADCKGPSPRWASTNLGIFLCISCSGIHRKLGTHISQVRSVTLDTWTPAQMAHFTKFGNARAAQYFEACIPENFHRPPHGDAMKMERFIRDKYESKRYITIENGGLGGQAAGPTYGVTSYSGTLGSRPQQVRGNQSYASGGYDNAQTVRRTGTSSSSYSSRFGSGSRLSASASSFSQTGRTGGVMAQSSKMQGSRPVNAMQRASTMKELINMGFSAQHAARAVEATEGDLQKAVDWVLEHRDTGVRGNGISSAQPPYQQAQQRDLLDFGEPVPSLKVNAEPPKSASARPKAMSNDFLMSTASQTNSAVNNANSEADFADFGAFESALPTPAKKTHESSSAATNGSLSSTIKTIYRQSPPLRSAPNMSGMPHTVRIDQPKQPGTPQSPARTRPSPKLMAMKAEAEQARKNIPETDLGLTSFTSLAQSQKAFSSAARDTQHVPNISIAGETSGNLDHAVPPPPPPQVVAVPNLTKDPASPTPPPPDTPPPDIAPLKDAETVKSVPQNSQTPEDKEGDKSAQQTATQEEEEEDDPFAALSMIAMKTAKSTSKKAVTPTKVPQFTTSSTATAIEQLVESGQNEAASTKPAVGFDLDELLG